MTDPSPTKKVFDLNRHDLLGGIAALLLVGPGIVRAQTPPPTTIDPAAIGKGLIEQRREQLPAAVPSKPIEGDGIAPEKPSPAPAGVAFDLQAVSFDNSVFLTGTELDALAAPLIGKRISLVELRLLAAQVNVLYASRGIVTARAYVPPQRIVDGAVRIALIEGRLGELKVAEGKYTSPDYVRPRLSLEAGQIVDLTRLRADIDAFNRTNDMRLQAQLQPGAQIGLTDVLISIAEPPRNSAQFFADTYGYESTGRWQGGISIKRSALIVDGDRANLYANVSDGGLTGSASYNAPVGRTRIGATYARSQIHVTQGPSASLDIRGYSDTGSLNLVRPIYAGDNWYTSLVGAFSYSAAKNRLAEQTVSRSQVYKATGGVSFGYDRSSRVSLGMNLTASAAKSTDTLETRARTFGLFNGDLSGLLSIAPGISLRTVAAGQYSTSQLIPSNQLFQLGGPNSIRGFQPGTASGSSGFFNQTELHFVIPVSKHGLDLFTFIDGGKTYSFDFGNRGIGAAGGGFRITVWRFDLDATYAAPIGGRRPGEGKGRADARLTLSF